ncbi:hypothetical protein ACQYAD_14045 [Neobacillus sp. SM06]
MEPRRSVSVVYDRDAFLLIGMDSEGGNDDVFAAVRQLDVFD